MTEVRQRPTKVLLVEHDPDGLQGLRSSLSKVEGRPFEMDHVGQLSQGLERLSEGGIDVVVLDLNLPDSEGLVTFERMYAFAPDVPIVVLTSLDDQTMATKTVQGGAQDYLVKGRVDEHLLIRSLRYAIERHRLLSALRSLSLIDDLTGLYNRRGFADLGDQHLKLAQRTNRTATLVFADLDRFRTINDKLGHHVGDRVLLRVADMLRATFRRSDILARLGADEFVVLALEASGEDSKLLAERLRDRVEEFNEEGEESYKLSLSVGLARYRDGNPSRLDELLAQADAAMYEEKRTKRKAALP